jgi:hypothetical protein
MFVCLLVRMSPCSTHLLLQGAMCRPVTAADVASELQVRGGLFPLMHMFPSDATHPGISIPWEAQDVALQAWLAQSSSYQAAAAELEAAHDV